MTIQKFAAALFALMTLLGCAEERANPPVAAAETEKALDQGALIGFRAENGAHVWLGVPYAAPPVGARRWRAPRPAAPWKGRRSALEPASRCLQLATGFDADEGFAPGQVIGAEDCLTLDIYAPSKAGPGVLPVMFWIHGGGNVWGRSSQFDGSRLAEEQRVIVIAAQYRLGPLGWFAHPGLRAAAETQEDETANFALLDLIAALRWTRDNVRKFGGNPELVTVFGESAGGRNVAALLAAPPAKDLFHRAVIQSGGFGTVSLAAAEGSDGDLTNPGLRIAAALGAEDAAALRALDGSHVLKAYGGGRGFIQLPQVIRDNVVLPEDAGETLLGGGAFHRVPVMIGSNRDEVKLFMAVDPEKVVRRLWMFPTPRAPDAYEAGAKFLSRLWRLAGVDQPARRLRDAGHEAVYAYRFDWDDGGAFLWTDTSQLLGAAHALELPFLFSDFSQLGSISDTLFTEETTAERAELAAAMGRFWSNFARDGDPSGAAAGEWPRYGAQARYLRLDARSDGGQEVREGAESFEMILADLKADPTLGQAERCGIIRSMARWRFARAYQEQAARATDCP